MPPSCTILITDLAIRIGEYRDGALIIDIEERRVWPMPPARALISRMPIMSPRIGTAISTVGQR